MIIDEIKKSNIEAMKSKDANARAIYSVLLNKAMIEGINKREKGLELSDVDLTQILQKTIKELIEEGENYVKAGNAERAKLIDDQKKLVEKFLPQMMSEEEIKSIILSMEDKSIPSVMKKFKSEFAGKCDMRLVQDVLKKI